MVVVQCRVTERAILYSSGQKQRREIERRGNFERVILAAGRGTKGVRGSRGLADFLTDIRIEETKKLTSRV